MVTKREWLVWSNEHRAWWRPKKCGYCVEVAGAGLYTEVEADSCCASRSRVEGAKPPEVKVHISEVRHDPETVYADYLETLAFLWLKQNAPTPTPQAEKHICKPYDEGCCCYQLADEPSEDCVKHGGAVKASRCSCGKFAPQAEKPQRERK